MGHVRIFKHYVRIPYMLLGIAEAHIFIFSMYAGAAIRFGGFEAITMEVSGALLPRAIVFASVMLIGMMSMGVYQARGSEGFAGVILRTAVSFLVGGMALSLFFFLFPDQLIGRGVIALAAIISFFLVWIVRVLFARNVDDNLLKPRVLLLGAGERAKNILEKVGTNPEELEFIIVGFLRNKNEPIKVPEHMLVHRPEQLSLATFAEEMDLDEIVVAVDDRRTGFDMDELLDCKLTGIQVVDVLTFFERETNKVVVDLLHPSWFVFSDGFDRSAMRTSGERVFDVIASGLLLLVTWPIMLLTAMAIKLEEGFRASIFYSQERVGLNGESFYVHKFRSMREDAEKGGKAIWAQENDDRVTKVGKFIRKVRIDELPQIFNVFKGDMGFVGPRPERPQFVKEIAEQVPFFEERHRVKPGITGWAQLLYPYGASIDDSKAKLEYDLYYVKNHSLMLDFLILIKTVEIILFGRGR